MTTKTKKSKPVKRWLLKEDDWVWGITSYGYLTCFQWQDATPFREWKQFLGVYKTKREAQAMLKKIKAFVAREIGE